MIRKQEKDKENYVFKKKFFSHRDSNVRPERSAAIDFHAELIIVVSKFEVFNGLDITSLERFSYASFS